MMMTDEFNAAKERVMTLPSKPGNDVLLELYALNKQAESGDISIEPPKMFDFVAQAKYNAWKSKLGMSSEEAKQAYIKLVNRLFEK
jgi:diazepam-binding inhibitor (GABA receptor modulator, acyl-CoA-binding protein)